MIRRGQHAPKFPSFDEDGTRRGRNIPDQVHVYRVQPPARTRHLMRLTSSSLGRILDAGNVHEPNENQTCKKLIEPALEAAS